MALSSRVVVTILSVACALQTVDSSNILGYLASPSRSHYIVHESLLRGLAAKGHNVSKMRILFDRFSPHFWLIFLLRTGDGRHSISNGQIEIAPELP